MRTGVPSCRGVRVLSATCRRTARAPLMLSGELAHAADDATDTRVVTHSRGGDAGSAGARHAATRSLACGVVIQEVRATSESQAGSMSMCGPVERVSQAMPTPT